MDCDDYVGSFREPASVTALMNVEEEPNYSLSLL